MQGNKEAEKRRDAFQDRRMLARKGFLCRKLLGAGSFSRVYWVESAAGGESYTCKISENERLLEREARILGLLHHPLFPRQFDFWKEGGRGFLLREYIAGSSLEDMLVRRGGFSAGRTAGMGLELAGGLKYLHGREERFLFRDIKPANIILCQDGGLKLIDLGCACSLNEKITSRAGSPGFAAPEQLRSGGVLTASCDVYGLGQTLRAAMGEKEGERSGKGRRRLPERGGSSETGGRYGKAGGFPERRGLPRNRGGRRQMREQKALKDGLLRVLEICTREEAGERIPDMESLEGELRRLLE